MTPLLEQFLSESEEFTLGIGEKLMQLEDAPNEKSVIDELFRLVHTLKGNSGLFTFPEMTRVLHAGEDLLGLVRSGEITYSRELADRLLDAMDFVVVLCGDIHASEHIGASRAQDSLHLAEALRALMPGAETAASAVSATATPQVAGMAPASHEIGLIPLAEIPEATRMEALRHCQSGEPLHWVAYTPAYECFFQGEDPLFSARQTPGLLWARIQLREPFPPLAELDTYRSILDFHLLTSAPREELDEYYRYIPDQVKMLAFDPLWLVLPQGTACDESANRHLAAEALRILEGGDLEAAGKAARELLEMTPALSRRASALRWLLLLIDHKPHNQAAMRLLLRSIDSVTVPDWTASSSSGQAHPLVDTPQTQAPEPRQFAQDDALALASILNAQRQILLLTDRPSWETGRLKAVAEVLRNVALSAGEATAASTIEEAMVRSLASGQSRSLLAWLDEHEANLRASRTASFDSPALPRLGAADPGNDAASSLPDTETKSPPDEGLKFGRRAEDALGGPRGLKVDQAKIDRLMNLIGELIVSKNALPYLAKRAEEQFGVRELSREIKGQYAVINRIADEMQDTIMQVRMMAVSFVFQRFPRLVRDTSRKLGKEVQLVLVGEQTEADKNIIESLADPLIHIVRNSLDHGLETPEVRRACGKPELGTLTIRAAQEADRVVIEVSDDGKGIDPAVIKRKAYERGLIDEAALERIDDRQAVNLVFAAGLSTSEVVSDLSGRGVGMDAVRSAVEKLNGTVLIDSKLGKGTTVRIELPLSMAVTQVMIVESDGQLFGVPMDHVLETVRIPRNAIHAIKQSLTAVLRGRIVPLRNLNALLGIDALPLPNGDDELAVLLVRAGNAELGLMIDGFHETVGVIQKPLNGFLSGLSAYSGSALMGDGSVLMILNIREMI